MADPEQQTDSQTGNQAQAHDIQHRLTAKDRDEEFRAIGDFFHQVLSRTDDDNKGKIVLVENHMVYNPADQDELTLVWGDDGTPFLRLKSYGLAGSDWEANLTAVYKLVDTTKAEVLQSKIPQGVKTAYIDNRFRRGEKDIVCTQSSRWEAIPTGDSFAHQFHQRFQNITNDQLNQAVNSRQPIRTHVPKT